jgi:hypothetical protein
MSKKIIYWLNWDKKIIEPNSLGLNSIPWPEISQYPIQVHCSSNDWLKVSLEASSEIDAIDQEKRIIKIGKVEIKEKRGGSQENSDSEGSQALKLLHQLVPHFIKTHPSTSAEFFSTINNWKFAPRFENIHTGTFTNITKLDIKSCYATIMQDYPLPCGQEKHLTDPLLIEQKLRDGQEGFIRFYLRQTATIKNNQIPFLPNYHNEINPNVRGCFVLYSKLFLTFKKQYQIRGKIIYTDFWMFEEKKGCVNPYLDYCQELKKQDEKKGKKLANVLYGVLGRNQRIGYIYHPFMVAVNHLAILQTYNLYRHFALENVLAIRSDCIYVKGELPAKLLKEAKKYHINKYKKVALVNQDTIFIHDTQELKTFSNSRNHRQELKKEFLKS